MKAVICGVNSKYVHSSFTAYTLKANVVVEGVELDIVEFSINDISENCLRNLYKYKADVYLFPVYIFNILYLARIFSNLKKVLPNCLIVAGGPEAEYGVEIFMRKHCSVDIVAKGEGELVLPCLLSAIQNGEELDKVNNIAYRKNGRIIYTVESGERMRMDELIFVYNEENIQRFDNKILYYEASRGCPYRCIYCLAALDNTVRYKSLDKIKEELTFFIDHEVSVVKFTDRTFNANEEIAAAVWQFIKENNKKTMFHFEIAADILTPQLMTLLKEMPSGYLQVEAGIQSAKKETLLASLRSSDLTKIEHNLKQIAGQANIHVHIDLIVGLPYERYDDFKASFNYAYNIGANMLQLGFLKVLKGSPIEGRLEDGAYVYEEDAPYEIISNKWILFEEILRIKALEFVLDKYHNSGDFFQTLPYIIKTFY
ncbi:MAG: B12-binding domain-containing radical SAM protein, partial [Clostridiales bacterium]|nr:B12-binding domain-containing radical SAM protein [Clostridiales bacterium]